MKISTQQKEFIKFCIVGGVATGIHYGIYLLLNRAMNTTLAFTIGYIVSFLANFVLSNYFTFKTRPSAKKGFGFAMSHFINYLLQVGLLNLFIHIGMPKNRIPDRYFIEESSATSAGNLTWVVQELFPELIEKAERNNENVYKRLDETVASVLPQERQSFDNKSRIDFSR